MENQTNNTNSLINATQTNDNAGKGIISDLLKVIVSALTTEGIEWLKQELDKHVVTKNVEDNNSNLPNINKPIV